MQHLDDEVAHDGGLTPLRRSHRHHPRVGFGQHLFDRIQFVGQWPVPHGCDPHASEHLGDPADMIEMWVGDNHEIEVPPAVRTEPPRGGFVTSGIDEDPCPGRLDQERVTLADVDRRDAELPSGQRPHRSRHDRHDHGDRSDRGRDPAAATACIAHDPHRRCDRGDDGRRTRGYNQPRKVGESMRDGEHTACRPCRHPEQPPTERR